MEQHTLLTYSSIEELRKIQKEREVFTFTFGRTKEMIDACPDVCIDISATVYYLQFDKNSIQLVYANFEEITEDTIIIAEEAISENALELLPFLVSDTSSYFQKQDKCPEQEVLPHFKPYSRQNIYKYNSTSDLDRIIHYSEEHNIPIATFSRVNGDSRKEFEQFNKTEEMALMDLTSVSYAIEDNKTLIYALEQLLNSLPNVKVIVQTAQVDTLLKFFPLFFDGQEAVCN